VLSSADIRASILRHLQADKWDAIDENLMAWPTNPPYKFALDCYTWGYCAFPDYTESARTKLTKFAVTKQSTKTGETISGYCFDEDQDVLWFEGTGQVAVAHWVAGDAQAASLVLDEMKKGWVQTSSGEWGLPYAANSGTGYGSDPLWATANTDACISSTVWYLLASYRYNPMAGSRTKQLDAGPEFWR
jgi:hypothetical protein